jgi:hypothetical protein
MRIARIRVENRREITGTVSWTGTYGCKTDLLPGIVYRQILCRELTQLRDHVLLHP